MSTFQTPQEALVATLLAASTFMPQIDWGTPNGVGGIFGGSPYYQEAPETIFALASASGSNLFPFVWYDIPDGTWEETFENAGHDEFEPMFRVYMQETDIAANASPYTATSVFFNLDTYQLTPRLLDGQNFQCVRLRRKSWRLYKAEERAPGTGRVWIAESRYSMWIVT